MGKADGGGQERATPRQLAADDGTGGRARGDEHPTCRTVPVRGATEQEGLAGGGVEEFEDVSEWLPARRARPDDDTLTERDISNLYSELVALDLS